MDSDNFSMICNHEHLYRMDENFVRCRDCGQSMISQVNISINKNRSDFTKENNSFMKNFDRNFSNIIEEKEDCLKDSIYEYYVDRTLSNFIIIDRKIKFKSDPVKFEVKVNGENNYLTQSLINDLLSSINAVRVDKDHFNNLKVQKKLSKNK